MEEKVIEVMSVEQLELVSMILFLKDIIYKVEVINTANKTSYLLIFNSSDEARELVLEKFKRLGTCINELQRTSKGPAIVRRYSSEGEKDFSIEDLFPEIKNIMRKEFAVSEISFGTWIEPLIISKVEGSNLFIMKPDGSEQERYYLEKKYEKAFQTVISEVLDKNYNIFFVIDEKDNKNNEEN